MITILATSASFFFALTYVLTRVGLKLCNPLSGVLISTFSAMVISLAIFIFTSSIEELAQMAILFFIVGGILGVFLARLLLYIAIDRVGAAIASPLSEIKPLFSGLAAILILGEKFTFPIALGMFAIIIGSITISSEQSGGKIDKKWKKKDLIYPVLAGIFLRKLERVTLKIVLGSIFIVGGTVLLSLLTPN